MKDEKRITDPSSETQRQNFITLMNNGDDGSSVRNGKATVFTDMFQEPEYGYQLFRVLHPEEKSLTKDDLAIITLKNVMVNAPYNDLGILAGDVFIILVEAQSTWSENILVRILIYLAYTYKNYISSHGLDVYESEKITLPKPDFYVIYTGKGEKPEEIRFSEEFFGGQDISVEIKARVIQKSQAGDIVDQYIQFTHILDKNVKKYGRTRLAIQKTIRYCLANNIMKNYLQERGEKEVIDLMMVLFDDETVMRNHDISLLRKGGFSMLILLVKNGKLSLKDAAEQAHVTEDAFRKKMEDYKPDGDIL